MSTAIEEPTSPPVYLPPVTVDRASDERRLKLGWKRQQRLLGGVQHVVIDHHANEFGVTAFLDGARVVEVDAGR